MEPLLPELQTARADVPQCVVTGIAGVGKSATVLEYVHSHKRRFDIVCWASAESNISISAFFLELGEHLGLFSQDDKGDRISKVRHWFEKCSMCTMRNAPSYETIPDSLTSSRDMRWLLVFDNVKYQRDISPFVPQSTVGYGSIIVTTRNAFLECPGVRAEVIIHPFSLTQGDDFLKKTLDSRCVRASSCPEVESAVSHLCGGLPVFLRFVGDFMATYKYFESTFWRDYDELSPPWLDIRFRNINTDGGKVELIYNDVLIDLSARARDTICVMSLLNGDSLSDALISSSLDGSRDNIGVVTRPRYIPSRIRILLKADTVRDTSNHAVSQELEQFSLVRREYRGGETVYVMNPTIQMIVRYQIWNMSLQIRQTIFRKAFDLLRRRMRKALSFREPLPLCASDVSEPCRHVEKLLSAAKKLRLPLEEDFAELLYDCGFATWQQRSHPQHGLKILQESLVILDGLVDPTLSDNRLKAGIHTILSRLFLDMGTEFGDKSKEHIQQALHLQTLVKERTKPEELTRRHEVHYQAARTDLATTLLDADLAEDALPILEDCLDVHSKWRPGQEVPFDKAKVLYGIAMCHMMKGNHIRALSCARQGSTTLSLGGTTNPTESQEFPLACVLRQVGRFQEALTLHHRVLNARLATFEEASIPVAQSYYALGTLYAESQDFRLAEDALQKSLRASIQIIGGAGDLVALARLRLAQVLRSLARAPDEEAGTLAANARLAAKATMENTDDVSLLEQRQPVLECRWVGASQHANAPPLQHFIVDVGISQ
ncbi:hypothetical protein HO133_004282 [Letharia lupina]|uniref:NB-ARC domain-containing protein n=1 Tax=Letharia lupina TaxID=560253 RepID=A0A8H6FJZ1_9LECA|nr:uncharacterized protein HO133_004282 [Letharia lupina]KAF6229945.1 hypothetical protein HO133_004282 [Letharia lupina]